MKIKKKNKLILIFLSSVIIAVILFIFVIGVGIYQFHWSNKFIQKIRQIIPYPAAIVGTRMVSFSDWENKIQEYQNTRSFYLAEDQIDLSSLNMPSDEEIKEVALEDLIKSKIILKLADKNKIEVSQTEIDETYKELILTQVKNGEQSAEESLQALYGLTVDQFKNTVIKEYLLRQKLTNQLKNDIIPIAQDKAKSVLVQARKDPKQFETLARSYGEDSSALKGGDIGYIGRGEMVTSYEDIVWKLNIGDISDLITTADGFYIVKVEDKKNIDGEEEIKVRHIFIKIDLDKILDQELGSSFIKRLAK